MLLGEVLQLRNSSIFATLVSRKIKIAHDGGYENNCAAISTVSSLIQQRKAGHIARAGQNVARLPDDQLNRCSVTRQGDPVRPLDDRETRPLCDSGSVIIGV